MTRQSSPRAPLLVALALAAGALLMACGGGSGGSGLPESRATDYGKALASAPPPLASLYDQGNELLPGGKDAFEQRLRELRGHPVVVNKWASWCGPCRAEFPYFQSQAAKRGTEVAFLAINSNDSEDAARTFLKQYPVPYPSYLDPDLEIAAALDAEIEFPATVFLDSRGRQRYVNRGGYASEEDLAADIKRYAR